MTESWKPILWSKEMVPAILNTDPLTWFPRAIDPDRPYKYMTRRVMSPQPSALMRFAQMSPAGAHFVDSAGVEVIFGCRYGLGTVLWGKETWSTLGLFDDAKPSELDDYCPIYYHADGTRSDMPEVTGKRSSGKTRPSIFMQRRHSRLRQMLVRMRCERLQTIGADGTCAEIHAEGFFPATGDWAIDKLRSSFGEGWDQINGSRKVPIGSGPTPKMPCDWASDPWVWVLTLVRLPDSIEPGDRRIREAMAKAA